MNILYMGQYRDVSLDGLHSEILLNNLSKIGKVTSRHVLSEHSKSYHNRTVFEENKTTEEYDILIQNLPVNSLCYTQKVKRNIVIPVFGSELLSEEDIDYLNLFDEVLIDNPFIKQATDAVLKKPTSSYNLRYQDFIQTTDQVISFPLYNQMKKFYTIIDYDHNNEYVFDLICEFISSTLNQENICLVLFLINANNGVINQIQRQIADIQKLCNIHTDNLTKIITAPISLSYRDLFLVHKSGDVFLDLQDYPKNSLNRYIASFYDNQIITLTDSNTKFTNIRDSVFSLNGHIVFDKSYLKYITAGQAEMCDHKFTNNYLDEII